MTAAVDVRAIEREALEIETIAIGPHAGPQTRAMQSAADLTFFGGEAGGGKTKTALMVLARPFYVPGYAGILFRREAVQLVGADSAWSQSHEVMRPLGGTPRESPVLSWRWPNGATVEMRHLQHESDAKSHQGKAYACIVFEEVTHFTASQFWYLVSRMRSTCGVKPHLFATCNPDPESFVAELIAWWIDQETGLPIPARDGALRWFIRRGDDSFDWGDTAAEVEARNPGKRALSLTFIRSRLSDNPTMTVKDPTYGDRLDALTMVERERLKHGNWKVRSSSGSYFREAWFRVVPFAPADRGIRWVRAWDLAATEVSRESPDPDWTRGVKLGVGDGRMCVADVIGTRAGPGSVEDLILKTAELDGRGCQVAFWQDPGQAGKAQAHALTARLSRLGFTARALPTSQNKEAFARVWAPEVQQGRCDIVAGPWNAAYTREAEGFPTGRYDDQIDATSLGWHALTRGVEVRSFTVRGI